MSLRRILALLVLVAALGAYLFVYEIPRARQEAEKEKLLGVDADAVVGLTLTYPDREIALHKDAQGWRITAPIEAPADEAVVKGLITTLADARVQRALETPPADLAPFGLDRPSVTVHVGVQEGHEPPAIAVGKNTPIGGRSYVKRGDDPKVYLTTTSLQFSLNKQLKDLRDKTLLAFQDGDVRRIEIRPADGPTVTLVRQDDDAWTVEPGGHPADPSEVRSYLSSLRATRAVDFPEAAPAEAAKYGLAAPRLAVSVTTGPEGQETVRRLLLGAETTNGSQKQVYAKVDGRDTIYSLGDWTVRSLGKTAMQFRDKTVLGFDPARVGKIELIPKAGEPVTLDRGQEGWTLGGGNKRPKADAVTRFLDDLRDLRGADIAAEPVGDPARFGLASPDLRIRLVDRDGQDMGTVLVARHDGKYYAMVADGPTAFEVRDYMFTRLDKRRSDFAAGGETPAKSGADEPDGTDDPDPEAGE